MITIEIPGSLGTFSKQQDRFNLKYIDAGLLRWKERWRYKKHRLDSYEILFVAKGALYLQVDNQNREVSENQILICSPYSTLFGYQESPPGTAFYQLRFFTDAFLCFQIESDCFSMPEPYKLVELFTEIIYAARSPGSPPYATDALTLTILTQISRFSKGGHKSYGAVKEIAEWVRQNASLQTTVRSISDKFGYNKDHLSRLFKAELGVTLKEHLNSEQLHQAKSLLLQSDYTIKEIAHCLECDSENLFVKFFKYHEGLSPTEYRRAMNNEK